MRETVAAGRYYERDGTLLGEEIAAHYNGPRGPGALPVRKIEHDIAAILVPDSPYRNCADCSTWAYKKLAESPLADVYILIAANSGSEESGLSMNTFMTPLGHVRIDQELARAIAAKGAIGINESIHERDHAIEVQLPMLLHAKKEEFETIKILPILLGKSADIKKLALDIKEALVELKRKPIFIVSTGLTHYGPLFHFVPFSLDIPAGIAALDKEIIDRIQAQDAQGLRALIDEKMIVMRGAMAVELLLRILRPCTVTLEQHYTSADILGDYKNSVSYAAITFETKQKIEPSMSRLN